MTEPHSTDLYVASGKGILYIAEWSGTTPPTDPTDYVDVGNCPSFEIEPTTERLPHYSSRSTFRLKDKNPVISTDYTLSFDLDELSAKNLERFFMGGSVDATGTIAGMQGTNKEYAIKFISDNPIGPNQKYYFWKCTISPSGPMQLISDGEWHVMSYTAEGLADTTNHSSSPYFDVKVVTTTTTTTTTTA